ncbi:MAG: hypothetical protein LCH85_22230 [Chloroflexi bacterium]|nr:hypothetical protein [Chloroflexota bacterium]
MQDDRLFWLTILRALKLVQPVINNRVYRRALGMICAAIEERYPSGPRSA